MIPTMIPTTPPRGGQHPICGPFDYIRDTREGRRIEVCRVSMRRRGVAEDNLLEFCTVEENVFPNSIALQNRGYALMHAQ